MESQPAKSSPVSQWVIDFVIVVMVLLGVGNFVAPAFVDSYEPDGQISAAFFGVVGPLLGVRIVRG